MELCKICGSKTSDFEEAIVLYKYNVKYYKCELCGFVQTECPYWLNEAYSTALIAMDVGAVQRNLHFSEVTQAVIQQFFDPSGPFLDYGGGYGLFVRLMRDRGFNFQWSDKFAPNLYSMGFESDPTFKDFTLITAFEVFEHLVDPLSEAKLMLQKASSLLFSTELLPSENSRPGQWWYYALEGGQHVSLFSRDSLTHMANVLGVHFATNGKTLHLFSTQPVSDFNFKMITKGRVARLVNILRKRSSLTMRDFEAMKVKGTTSVLKE